MLTLVVSCHHWKFHMLYVRHYLFIESVSVGDSTQNTVLHLDGCGFERSNSTCFSELRDCLSLLSECTFRPYEIIYVHLYKKAQKKSRNILVCAYVSKYGLVLVLKLGKLGTTMKHAEYANDVF